MKSIFFINVEFLFNYDVVVFRRQKLEILFIRDKLI